MPYTWGIIIVLVLIIVVYIAWRRMKAGPSKGIFGGILFGPLGMISGLFKKKKK